MLSNAMCGAYYYYTDVRRGPSTDKTAVESQLDRKEK